MSLQQIIAIIIFLCTMGAIITGKVHNTVASLTGAACLVLTHILSIEDCVDAVDVETICILVGMMLLVAVIKNSGIFEYIAIKAAKIAKGRPWPIMVIFIFITAVCSGMLDNVTTVLLVGPMTLAITNILKVDPVPYIITQIMASNIGGTATLIGDPPNIMIGSAAKLSFVDFILNTGMMAGVSLIFIVLFFYFSFRKELKASEKHDEAVTYPSPQEAIADRKRFAVSVVIFAAAIVMLVTHAQTGLTVATIGVFIRAFSLLASGGEALSMIKKLDYKTLLFFIGLFVVVGGMEQTGVLNSLAGIIDAVSGNNVKWVVAIVLWLSALASAFVDNIPFAATMIPVIRSLAQAGGMDLSVLAWALSMGTDIGGCGTPIGASANVVGISVAAKNGHFIGWGKYCRYAAPATVLVILISMVCIYVRYF